MSFIQKLYEIKFPSADAHVHIHTELFKYLLYLLICFSKNVSFKNCFHIVLRGVRNPDLIQKHAPNKRMGFLRQNK